MSDALNVAQYMDGEIYYHSDVGNRKYAGFYFNYNNWRYGPFVSVEDALDHMVSVEVVNNDSI
jgi:CDP-glycerol glycerophosphotransferase (TagB/SpsB family)